MLLHLKMILRSWWRARLSTLISVVSLTVGLTCSTILILFALGEYQVSRALGDTDRIYLIERADVFYSQDNVRSSETNPRTAVAIKERYPMVEAVVGAFDNEWRYLNAKISQPSKGHYAVTRDFVRMFDIPVVEGDLQRTLSTENEIAVTNSFMLELFGRRAAIGDVIAAQSGGSHWVNGKPTPVIDHLVTITTILDERVKTPMAYGALSLLPDHKIPEKGAVILGTYHNFISLTPGSSIEQLAAQIKSDSTVFDPKDELSFRPFAQVYLDGSERSDLGGYQLIQRRDPKILSIGLTVAFAVLLIAAFNYVNITMTRARGRLRNIAAQWIFGASKRNVRFQTLLDTALLVVFCCVLSLLMLYLALPQFNVFMDSTIGLSDLLEPVNLAILLLLLTALIVLSSLYILVRIEIEKPLEGLKNSTGKRSAVSNVMVIAQFVVSITLLVVGLNIMRQMNFIGQQIPAAHTILQVKSGQSGEPLDKNYIDKLLSDASVLGYLNTGPFISSWVSVNGVAVKSMSASHELIDFYQIKLLEGRSFVSTDSACHVVVNQTLLRTMELPVPAQGQVFEFNGQRFTVVGVVEDFMYESAQKHVEPLIIRHAAKTAPGGNFRQIYLKVSGRAEEQIDHFRAIHQAMFPQEPLPVIKTVATLYKEMHSTEQRLLTMVEIFMVISALLTAAGLFGLSFYTVQRRTKEIALRKIHGSTRLQVVLLLCKTFALWLGVSCVVALPAAYFLSQWWLSSFVFRVEVVWWVFAVAVLLSLVVTFVTIIFQSLRAASASPCKSLKTE